VNRSKHADRTYRRPVRKGESKSPTKHPAYRVTGTWPAPRAGATYHAADRAHARKIARAWAAAGATVVIERAKGFEWREVERIDGPALAAAREAEQRAAAEAEAARLAAEQATREQARAAANQARRDRAQAAALMVQPPVPRTPQQRTARHTAGRR
jgi:hypothetical protein